MQDGGLSNCSTTSKEGQMKEYLIYLTWLAVLMSGLLVVAYLVLPL